MNYQELKLENKVTEISQKVAQKDRLENNKDKKIRELALGSSIFK